LSDDDLTPLPPLITIKRTATHLDCSQRHVRRLIASGDLEARRVGKRLIRVSRESLLKFGEPVGSR
jgi:excisionase family DNA binding protein